MLRRGFLKAVVGGIALVWAGLRAQPAQARERLPFVHGIASGDPLDDAVIIWTRISGAEGETVRVRWQVASDPDMQDVLKRGRAETGSERDYTVKVDVRGLPAGRTLYYQFETDNVRSPVGRTKTLPKGAVSSARFAVVSCSNHPAGYFHAYREIAKQDDLDAVLHLGDYIYEYGQGGYATEYAEQLGRVPEPAGEIVSLDDYRKRHAQYRADVDSCAMLEKHPLIAIWDDHEFTNDAWRDGAQNHQQDEGEWPVRRDAALQAYFEWMPIRGRPEGADTKIFRQFQYGDLLSLTMLDTRLYGRDIQPDVGEAVTTESVEAAMKDAERRMLGRRQESWLRDHLDRSNGTVWQLIGQQVLVMPLLSPDLEPLIDPEGPSMLSREQLDRSIAMSKDNPPMLLDTWNGYPIARQDFLTDLKNHAANPVVLSGDLHTSMAGNLIPHGGEHPVAVEFMTTSVTSPGFKEYLPERSPGALRGGTMETNPFLKYMETTRRGWMHVIVTPEECTAEGHLLDGVRSQEYTVDIDRRLSVKAGEISKGLF